MGQAGAHLQLGLCSGKEHVLAPAPWEQVPAKAAREVSRGGEPDGRVLPSPSSSCHVITCAHVQTSAQLWVSRRSHVLL